jgi:hypothetical protein
MVKVDRAVVRETAEIDYRTRKPFVLMLVPGGRLLKIKVKGSRSWFTVTVKQVWQAGAQNRAVELRAEKAARRKERKAGRNGSK